MVGPFIPEAVAFATFLRALGLGPTHTLHSNSFWGLSYRILNMNPKKEVLCSLWVVVGAGFAAQHTGYYQ